MKKIAIFALALVSTSAFAVEFGPGAGGAVPDNNPTGFSSSINIGMGVTAVNNVRLVGLTHTWIGDITITLTNPDNVSATLAARVGRVGSGFGDSSNLNGDYVFANAGADLWAAAGAIGDAQDIAGGTYMVSGVDNAASSLTGLATATSGNWTLKIVDAAGGDLGNLGEWYVDVTPVPEPATMTALALGAAAMLRRRRK